MARPLPRWIAALVVALAVSSVACKGRHKAAPPVNLAGIAAVPSTATVVVNIDVPRLASSPLIGRAVEQLLLRDADLAGRWQRLHDECKLDVVASVQRVVLALGPKQPGGAPVLMVATGKFGETELATCVRGMVGKGGGALSAKTVGGRTLYQAKESNRSVWFGFSQADTVVLGSNEAFVTEALSAGKKVADNAELKEYLSVADRKRAIWAAGQVDPAIGERLLGPSGGTMKAGPRGFVVALDATAGAHLELGAIMASVDDAKALELLAKQQLGLFAMAAQAKGLGHLVGKATAVAEGKVVRLAVTLDPTEINQLLSAVDSAGTGSQDAPPAAPSQPSP
jgi:hypothetical protein